MLKVEKIEKVELEAAKNVNLQEGKWVRRMNPSYQRQLLFTPNNLLLASSNTITLPSCLASPQSVIEIGLEGALSCIVTHSDALFACATPTQVLLFHWDSILREWERLVVSEGEGRICSLCLTLDEDKQRIFVTAIKWDSIVVYSLISLHPLSEEGPLLLESITLTSTVDKIKELCSHSHSFLTKNNIPLLLIEVSTYIKLWEFDILEDGKGRLLRQQSVCGVKKIVACELELVGEDQILLIFGADGCGCIYLIHPISFCLINRFKLEEEEDEGEWQVLCSKLIPSFNKAPPSPSTQGGGDCPFGQNNGPHFPELLLLVVSTQRISLLNAKSGHVIFFINSKETLGVEELLVQEAALGGCDPNIKLALQSPLSSIIHIIHLNLIPSSCEDNEDNESKCSLISAKALDPKSVLRKRIKSPVRPDKNGPNNKARKSIGKTFTSKAVKPAWARSRSRPLLPSSIKKTTKAPPASARSQSQSSEGHNVSRVWEGDDSFLTLRPVRIPKNGTYEQEDLSFGEKLTLGSRLSGGQSYARMALSPNGRVMAGGGSVSPVGVMKINPEWNTVRLLKDISRVTSLHFNFHSNLLLVGCNDGRTRVVGWEQNKELLNWTFSSKFNEHLHSQFYFMDKFVVQPQGSDVVLYAIKELGDKGWLKLLAKTFPFPHCQHISAMGAANLFLSHQIVVGLSNKSLEILDVNAEKVSLSIPAAHSKPLQTIRINEAPLGQGHHDVFLTSSPTPLDPIKLWDLRTTQCVLRISDSSSGTNCLGTARPALSPCGRYIATGGVEDNSLLVYDTRKIQSRLTYFGGLGSSVLDCAFDTTRPMIWAQCRNGTFFNFYSN